MQVTRHPEAPRRKGVNAARLRRMGRWAASLTAAGGAFVLCGWLLGIQRMANPFGEHPAMMPNTSLGFLLVGVALLLRRVGPSPKIGHFVSLACAWFVVLFALAVLAEYAFDRSLGIDELMTAAPPAVAGGAPGRPASNTAVAFLLTGVALLTLDLRIRRYRPAETFAMGTLLVATVSLIAHAFGTTTEEGAIRIGPLTAMAITTSILFLSSGFGVLSREPSEGLMGIATSEHLGGTIVRRLLLGTAVIPAVTFAAEYAEQRGWIEEALSGTLISLFATSVVLALIFVTGRNANSLDEIRQAREREFQRWKYFFDRAEFGAVLGGPELTLEVVNESFARMHGLTVPECLGRSAIDLFAPEVRVEAARQLALANQTGHLRFESEHVRKDGTTFPVDIDVTAVRGASGEVLFRAAIVQDITQRKAAEAARARLASIVDSSGDAIFSSDFERRLLTWNAAAERLFGYTAAEAIGQFGSAFTPEEFQAERRLNVERLRRGETIRPFETVVRCKDGSLLPVLATMSPVLDAAGRPVAISIIAHDISERKAMEESLRRSEESLRKSSEEIRRLFQDAVDGIFVADLDGRYTDVNASGCRLLQLSREEIVGRTILDLLPPEEVPALAESKEILLRGEPHTAEWHVRRADGTFVPVEVSAKILPDGRWQGFVRDITERKEAERALRASRDEEQRLRLQIEALSRADRAVSEVVARTPGVDMARLLEVIVFQAQTLTNARYVALGIGGSSDRPFESWVQRGVSPEEAAAIGRTPRPVGLLGYPVRTGESLRVANLRQHADYRGIPPNHPYMTRLLAVPIRYRDRSVGNLYLADKRDGAEFNAEDQRVVELLADRAGLAIETATLYAQTDMQRVWLQTVVEHLPEATVVVDASGKIIAHSRSAERFLGAATADYWGNTHGIDLRDPSTSMALSRTEHPLELALAHLQETAQREFVVGAGAGRMVPTLVSVAVIRDSQGKNIGAIMLLQDITTVKELERLREEWVSIVAHDLRQPVATIRMAADMLRRNAERTEMSERILSSLDRITSSSTRLGRMITDLLDASRLEAHHLKLERSPFDLHAHVRAVLGRMSETFGGRPVRVIAPDAPVPVEADPDRIEQVLTNLLSNAVKYGAPGSEITVEITSTGRTAGVKVTNVGHGIPPEQLPRLFDRFERAWAPKETRTPGIGLGLYISKGLIDAHCGRMWVQSTPGQTTTFGFDLPVRPVETGVLMPSGIRPLA